MHFSMRTPYLPFQSTFNPQTPSFSSNPQSSNMNTLLLVTLCSMAGRNSPAARFEPGTSGSTVRRSTICALSPHNAKIKYNTSQLTSIQFFYFEDKGEVHYTKNEIWTKSLDFWLVTINKTWPSSSKFENFPKK